MQSDESTAGLADAEGMPAPEEQSESPPPTDLIVDRWWEEHFPGTAVARDTQAWNVAHAAKENLKRLLRTM
jgi:hypothetical protein